MLLNYKHSQYLYLFIHTNGIYCIYCICCIHITHVLLKELCNVVTVLFSFYFNFIFIVILSYCHTIIIIIPEFHSHVYLVCRYTNTYRSVLIYNIFGLILYWKNLTCFMFYIYPIKNM